MTLLPALLSSVLVLLALAHAWWAVGGIWPATSETALAHGVIGDGRTRMPPPWQCWAVTVALLAVAAWPWLILALPSSRIVLIGGVIIGAVFFLRGLAAFSSRWRRRFTAQPFATRDIYLYSPLCLLLAGGFLLLLTREMV